MTQDIAPENEYLNREAPDTSNAAPTLQIAAKVIRMLAAYFVIGMMVSQNFIFVSAVLNCLVIGICIVEQLSIFRMISETHHRWRKRLLITAFSFPLLFTIATAFELTFVPSDIWSKNGELTSQKHAGRSDIRVYKEYIAQGNDNSLVVQRSGLLGTPILYDHLVGRFTGLDSASWDRDKPVLNLTESIINSNRRAVTITFHENGSYEVQKSD